MIYGTPLSSGTCTPFGHTYLYLVCGDGMQLVGGYYYSCTRGELVTGNPGNHLSYVSNEQERSCPSPEVVNLVETFVGSDYTPLSGQETFSEGDVITSRCQNAKSEQFNGSVTRRCERGQWSGDRPRCESTNFFISVGNTALQNITENGTIIVYPISGFVSINCKLVSNVRGTINMYKNNEEISSYRDRSEFNLERSRIINPSEANSGTYKCESSGQSLSIDIVFKGLLRALLELQDLLKAYLGNALPLRYFFDLLHVFSILPAFISDAHIPDNQTLGLGDISVLAPIPPDFWVSSSWKLCHSTAPGITVQVIQRGHSVAIMVHGLICRKRAFEFEFLKL
ncbi:hypothetical protein HOLleu_15627 [Holothuria leucospilota]|uniref:Sushi domain-containing protein n=1 Tax=Holothuria leucospilota TaxID=206669 RepID=A0A9Q1C4Y4_HOLLE|nr:hypothetical protein HOLleu_15627 [Holothuria leucospilota]